MSFDEMALFDTPDLGPKRAGNGSNMASGIQICALNVNSPSASRAEALSEWLLATDSNVLVLTEMQPSAGGRLILSRLESEGFTTTCTPGWKSSKYFSCIATIGASVSPISPAAFDPRVSAVDVVVGGISASIIGVYGVTNGMTPESSSQREDFQRAVLEYLRVIKRTAVCVVGDLNVVEPGHRPHLPAFEEHDYAFYRGLRESGLRDAYRQASPLGEDHSWFSPRLGSQRLDHCLVNDRVGEVRECRYDHSTRSAGLSDHAAMLTSIGLASAEPPAT